MLPIPDRLALLVVSALVSSSAQCGAPFQTDDPAVSGAGHVDLLASYQSTLEGTDDPAVSGAGHVDLLASYQSTLEGDTRNGNAPGIELHFGLSDRAELDVASWLAFSTASDGGTRRGYGDTTIELKYVLVPETESMPLVSLVPKLTLATGNADGGLGNGGTRLLVGAAAQKSRGPLVTYGNVAYAVNDGPGNRNFWFAGWEAQRQLSARWILGAELFASTAQATGQRASSGFNVGGYYVFGERDQALFSAGRGLANVHETNRVSAYVGYQRSF